MLYPGFCSMHLYNNQYGDLARGYFKIMHATFQSFFSTLLHLFLSSLVCFLFLFFTTDWSFLALRFQ